MKTTSIALTIIMRASTFCLALQQSCETSQGTRGPVLVDLNDSDALFSRAYSRAR